VPPSGVNKGGSRHFSTGGRVRGSIVAIRPGRWLGPQSPLKAEAKCCITVQMLKLAAAFED